MIPNGYPHKIPKGYRAKILKLRRIAIHKTPLGYEHYQNPACPNSSNAHGRGVTNTYKKNVVEMQSQTALKTKTKKIVHIIFSKRK
jgi:hypothetical protein